MHPPPLPSWSLLASIRRSVLHDLTPIVMRKFLVNNHTGTKAGAKAPPPASFVSMLVPPHTRALLVAWKQVKMGYDSGAATL
jgi:hypothetical protein